MVAQLKKNSKLSFISSLGDAPVETSNLTVGCVVSKGTRIEGDFHSEGDMRLDGHVIGNVSCDGRLIVGQEGQVEGKICSKNANIKGRVKGEIEVTETLNLASTAFINGEIQTQYISVELGAIHNGKCQVGLSA